MDTNEDEDPKKYIEQLSGKLGQSLRTYNEDEGVDNELQKFVANSAISAIDTSDMDESDINDIKNKVDDSGEGSTDEPGIDNNDLSDDGDNPFGGDEEDTVESLLREIDIEEDLASDYYNYDENGAEKKFTNSIEPNKNEENIEDDLLFSEKNRTFDENNNDMIEELVDAMFNSDPTPTVPVKEPVVKPGTDEPYIKPIKPSQKPFSPGRRIHEDPQPKAKL